MHIFTIWDYILLPFYAALFIFLMNVYNKKHNSKTPLLAKYFSWGFKIKIVFSIIFALAEELILGGDTEMYFTAGIDYKNIIFGGNLRFLFGPAQDFGDFYEANMFRMANFGYVSAERNLTVIKFVGLFSTVSFNSYMIISLFFAVISFIGLWGMFKVFYSIYPKYHKAIFCCFFLIPTVLFWGSGILKDTLCVGFLGMGFYTAYKFLFEKKYLLKYVIIAAISFFLLYMIKVYIVLAFIPMLALWYYLRKLKEVQSVILKLLLYAAPFVAIAGLLAVVNVTSLISADSAAEMSDSMNASQQTYKTQTSDGGALIDYGDIPPTFAGIAKLLPQVVITALFRPYLWEADKITSFLAALEGTFLLGLTVFVFFRRGPFSMFKILKKDNAILFCFVFAIVFATAVGLNCYNMGTLVRYKIPCLPFYLLSLILIYKTQNEQKDTLAGIA